MINHLHWTEWTLGTLTTVLAFSVSVFLPHRSDIVTLIPLLPIPVMWFYFGKLQETRSIVEELKKL